MAQKKELHITISPTGEVQVLVKCVAGASCVDETRFLEDALGNTIESRDLTSDYYASSTSTDETIKNSG